MDSSYVQITTTTPTKDEAEALADSLVRSRLAACVQVLGPIGSTYWWKGELTRSQEWMCVIKTSHDLIDRILTTVRDQHSYENPELTVVPIIEGSASYLRWIGDEVGGKRSHNSD